MYYPTNSYIFPSIGTPESLINFFNQGLDDHYYNRYIPPAYKRLSILLEKILDEVLQKRIKKKNYNIIPIIQIFNILINSSYGHKFKLLSTCYKRMYSKVFGIRFYQFQDSRECLNIIVPFNSNNLNERIMKMDNDYISEINKGIETNAPSEYFYQVLRKNVYLKKATFKEFVNYNEAIEFIRNSCLVWRLILRFTKKN